MIDKYSSFLDAALAAVSGFLIARAIEFAKFVYTDTVKYQMIAGTLFGDLSVVRTQLTHVNYLLQEKSDFNEPAVLQALDVIGKKMVVGDFHNSFGDDNTLSLLRVMDKIRQECQLFVSPTPNTSTVEPNAVQNESVGLDALVPHCSSCLSEGEPAALPDLSDNIADVIERLTKARSLMSHKTFAAFRKNPSYPFLAWISGNRTSK